MKRKSIYLLLLILGLSGTGLQAQIVGEKQDTTKGVRQDAIYNRPFITMGKIRTAVGGYLEANTNYFAEDGISEGFSMEMRRFNLFLYSQIHPRVRFLSELEFEHGTEEIALETALLDFELLPSLNFRGGIILPALGLVNTNHDSPNWEFIDRPLSSTGLIPTTLSEVGFGLHGKLYPSESMIFSYDAYIVNGLQEDVILNSEGRTYIPAGKTGEMFGEDNNGTPMLNGRVAIAHRKLGELGVAFYGGVYNRFRMEGEQVAPKQMLSIMAVDFGTQIGKLTIQGEAAYATIDVPEAISEIYGTKQYAGFVELIYPVLQRPMLGFKKAKLNLALRGERIDYNVGQFRTNITENIGDENTGIAFGIGFRPLAGTIIRANYRYHWIRDVLDNPAARLAGFQFGIATYF